MAIRMGVNEFRDRLMTIVRSAREPVIVTDRNKVVGWFTPSNKARVPVKKIIGSLDNIRRSMEARGIDVAARLKALGLEDDQAFDDPWVQARPRTKTKGK
jgi:hypothetical protein